MAMRCYKSKHKSSMKFNELHVHHLSATIKDDFPLENGLCCNASRMRSSSSSSSIRHAEDHHLKTAPHSAKRYSGISV